MNKTINKLLLLAALMGGAAGMTSCDDIVANTDNPTVPDTNKDNDSTKDDDSTKKDDSTKQPTTEELIAQAKQLLADAQEEGAVVNAEFTYNGKTYMKEMTFKQPATGGGSFGDWQYRGIGTETRTITDWK